MTLPLAKLTILLGAGIAGTVLAQEGRISNVSNFLSGAFKIVFKQIRHDDSTPSSAKPRNDSLLAQVNNLRQELQLLASNRSITIVTSSGSGSKKYGIIVVVIVVGYGYIWRKGWKLPDMMFANRRSLADARNAIAKKLENVLSSIAATRRNLTTRIDRVECNLDECAELTAATKEEVSGLRGEMKVIGVDVQSVHHAVQTLETKINRIEDKQSHTNEGVRRLVLYARDLENRRTTELIQEAPSSSSRPALEMPRAAPLPPIPTVEPPSPSGSDGSYKRPLLSTVSASGLKELNGISEVFDASSPSVSNGAQVTEETNNGISGSVLFGRRLSGVSAFLTRTRSAVQSFK